MSLCLSQYAVMGDSGDVLHREIRAAFGRRSGLKDLGDSGMLHERERLALGLEAGNDFARVHARLDELDGDAAADGLFLFGQPDFTHAAFADHFEQMVRTNDGCGGSCQRVAEVFGGVAEKATGFCIGGEQRFHVSSQLGVTGALAVQEGGALFGLEVQGGPK